MLCGPKLHQISIKNITQFYNSENSIDHQEFMKNSTYKGHLHTHTHTCTFTRTVHLVLTDPVAHLGLVECEEPPLLLSERCRLLWSGSWLWIPDAAPNPVSQPLLSSMVERGRTAEQISLCFSTLVKAAPANTPQHSGT